ncbi:PREDICTED: uncharacterized protein LOC102016656 [Chinchilla lanigera]|uniref:uncharacterized protein LOC102016656 n=1 Tax=Chinchilla lanigera TaxID=34839 RepID=UPI00069919F2|nr:PREDICTED: uncharacterized protein LOC102016656 [Chinchilla lanigera]
MTSHLCETVEGPKTCFRSFAFPCIIRVWDQCSLPVYERGARVCQSASGSPPRPRLASRLRTGFIFPSHLDGPRSHLSDLWPWLASAHCVHVQAQQLLTDLRGRDDCCLYFVLQLLPARDGFCSLLQVPGTGDATALNFTGAPLSQSHGSQCGCQARSLGITWKLTRNADVQSHPKPLQNNPRVSAHLYVKNPADRLPADPVTGRRATWSLSMHPGEELLARPGAWGVAGPGPRCARLRPVRRGLGCLSSQGP